MMIRLAIFPGDHHGDRDYAGPSLPLLPFLMPAWLDRLYAAIRLSRWLISVQLLRPGNIQHLVMVRLDKCRPDANKSGVKLRWSRAAPHGPTFAARALDGLDPCP